MEYFEPVQVEHNFDLNDASEPRYINFEGRIHTEDIKPDHNDYEDHNQFYTMVDREADYYRNVEVLHRHEPNHAQELDQAESKRNCDGLFRKSERQRVRNIKTSNSFRERYLQVTRGVKCETAELNINVKTLTKNLLTKYVKMKEFSKEEAERIQIYENSKANFTTTQELFGVQKLPPQPNQIVTLPQVHVTGESDRIRLKCFEEYSSTRFVRSILKAEKMAFKNKLIMIKFLENIRQSSAFPESLRKWKNK